MSSAKYTPGPLSVREPEAWPYDIEIVDQDGELVWSERRYAHATRQRSVADCMAAVGFDHDERPRIVAALERQLADIHLRAAAPLMFEALKNAVESGLVPKSSVLDGGASRHSHQVQVADQIRAAIAAAEGTP